MPDETPGHECHCRHVVKLEVKMSIAQWAIGIVTVAIVGLLLQKTGELISLRLRDGARNPYETERIAPDRP